MVCGSRPDGGGGLRVQDLYAGGMVCGGLSSIIIKLPYLTLQCLGHETFRYTFPVILTQEETSISPAVDNANETLEKERFINLHLHRGAIEQRRRLDTLRAKKS